MRRGESLADARLAGGKYARPRSGSRAATSSSPSSCSQPAASSVLVQSDHNKRNSGSEIVIDATVSMEAEAEAWAALELQPQPAAPSWWEVESSTPLQLTYEEEWTLFGVGHSSSAAADTTAYEEDDSSSSWRIDPIWNFNPTSSTNTTTEGAAAAAAATINSKN